MNTASIKYNTIAEILQHRAKFEPNQVAYTFLVDGVDNKLDITYSELDAEARKITGYLQSHCKKGDRAVLFYPPGLDFIKAFFGCMYSGIIAVPSYPPKMNRSAERMSAILSDAAPSILLTTSDTGYEKTIKKYLSIDVPIVNTDEIKFEYSKRIKDASIVRDDLAFLQYTSGSTGSPKGVMISHKNLLHNEHLMQQSFNISKQSVVVGWLPFYHDMGLIGNILQPFYSGCPCILMSPVHFLQKPLRWLQAISKYKGTVSGGPNFAYDLCCEKISKEDIKRINLDTWKVAFNGAEPVREGTLKKFYEKFRKVGFAAKSFLPCYGMAETTLLVSGISVDKKPVTHKFHLKEMQYQQNEFTDRLNGDKIKLVSCGSCNGFTLALVDENGCEVADGIVGEIWLKGESVAEGYWNNNEETNYTFKAQMNGTTETYLRTGDLGIKKDGELYIAGRIKDLIILNGRNYYPQDIEFAVGQSNNLVVKESIAAFSIDTQTEEQLIVAAEIEYQTNTKTKPILQDIKRKIIDEFEIAASNIVLVRKGTLLKTTSGKIQRKACKKAYLSNSLHTVVALLSEVNFEKADLASFNQKELEIFNIIKDELNNQVIGKDTDLFNIGLDSIRLTRIAYRLGEHYDKDVPADFVIENSTISKIAKKISCLDEFEPFIKHKDGVSFPSSGLQEIIWFNQQRNPESTGYNIPVILEYNEGVNIDVLNKSLCSLIDKYAILRTNFQLDGSTIIQKIRPSGEINIKIIDLSANENSNTEELVFLSIKNESVKVFNLEKDLLIRATLIKLTPNKYLFLIVIHHILVDGTSVALILNELKEVYQQLLQGENTVETLPEFDFVDFTLYERTRLSDNELITKKDFWLEELKGKLPNLNFPLDYSLLESKSREGKSFYFSIDQDLSDKIKATVKQTKLNRFSYLLTAYYLLLHRLSGSYDLVIGSPVSMRKRKELENMPGLLINTAMFRTKLNTEETLQELVNRVYEHSRRVLNHADYPFSQVLRDLKFPIGETQLAISSVFFNYLDFTNNNEANQLFNAYKANPGVDLNFDLNLYAIPENDCIKFRLDYCKNHFKEDSIEKLAELYIKVLTEIVESPETVLKELKAEIRENQNCVIPKNDFEPFTESDVQKSITEKFNEITAKYPARIACKTNTEKYTYSEINGISNGIANQIASCCSNKLSAIGLLFGHEATMIFSILGVLKSGNYYVPLDSEYPFDRLVYILNDSDIHVILTNNHNLSKAIELVKKSKNNLQLINLDERNNSNTNLIHKDRNSPSSLAYILYTSGSTGTPKGVMQTHEYVMHLTYSFTNSLHISKDDCFTLIPSFNFSASVMDLFGVLLNGASLYLVDIKKEGIYGLVEGMKREEVTVYHSVPTVFREVVGCGLQVRDLIKLRLIYLAGEPLLKSDVELYKTNFHDDCILVNGLGCTEFNICRQFFIDKQTDISTSIIPIGYKALGVDLLIVDENRVETKNHETGEIAIRSRYLSVGYWNSADVTEQKFKIINPETKEKIYYTGDLGRKLADGCVMHLGRKDFQVKLRGQRIELAEIETTMLKIDGINRAVVSLKENESGKYLCAYFISDRKKDTKALKSILKEVLPEYMIPSYFIQMESFPLTDTGKVDRRNLPAPVVQVQIIDSVRLTDNEIRLSKIWAEVLKIAQTKITKNSNFFEIGGNSLSAIQLMSKINSEFEVSLTITEIFQYLILKDLAVTIEGKSQTTINLISEAPKQDYYPLSPAQKSLWVLSQMSDASIAFNLTGAYKIRGYLNIERLQRSLDAVTSKYEILRTVFVEFEGEPMMKIREQMNELSFIKVGSENCTKKELDSLLNKKIETPFNLSEGPLFNISLIKINEDESFLFYAIHHLVADGWSAGVLIKELLNNYNGIGDNYPLIQYKDYTYWILNKQDKRITQERQEYWKQKLTGDLPVLNLPYLQPRPLIQTHNGNELTFKLEQNEISLLNRLTSENNASLFMVLVGTLKILFYKYTGQTDIILGTDIAGRTIEQLENQIGYFLNLLPLRTIIDTEESLSQHLSKVKNTILGAFENQDYPIENIIKDLQLRKDPSRSLLFDVLVLLQNFNNQQNLSNAIGGVDISEYELINKNSLLDLTFEFIQKDGNIDLKIRYNTDLFQTWQIENFYYHFIQLLKSISTSKDGAIKNLKIISESESDIILNKFNSKKTYLRENNVIDLFKQQVQKTSDFVAVECGDKSIIYSDLYNKAIVLSNVLISKHCVKLEDKVGIFLEKNELSIIAIFGILFSGAAYVPIDIDFPQERINTILNDCSITIIVSDNKNCLSTILAEKTVVNVETAVEIVNQNIQPINLGSKIRRDNLAYILYTSGSTGSPKGVMIKHGSLTDYIQTFAEYFKLTEQDSIIQQSSLSFDTSVEEIFPILSKGGKIQVVEQGGKDIETILTLIEEKKANILSSTPRVINELNYHPDIIKKLRILISGGELLKPNHINRLITQVDIYNTYGPTESTVCATFHKINNLDDCSLIGKPFQNRLIYILNEDKQLQPIGIEGEIYIGGEGLAKGYLKNDTLTNEVFSTASFDPHIRLYKSGDKGKWLQDGTIKILGRIDEQVKIRGYRVELAEIENQILSFDGIEEAFVDIKEEAGIEKFLCAYYKSKRIIDPSFIRQYLLEKIPFYMVPARYMQLEEFPLSINRKINKKALPDILESPIEYIAPTNLNEEILVKLFAEVLGKGKVGSEDDFYMLGGDSIKAIQIISRVRNIGYKLEIKDIISYPVIKHLAKFLVLVTKKSDQSIITGQVPLTPVQRRFFSEGRIEPHHFNMAILLLRKERLNRNILEPIFKKIQEHHDALRITFFKKDGIMNQIINGDNFPVSIIECDIKNPNASNTLQEKINEIHADLNLEQGPLMKIGLFHLKDGDRLLIVIHHLVIDGISWRILIEDINTLYNQHTKNKPFELPLKSDSYKLWAEELVQYASSNKCLSEIHYWEKLESYNFSIIKPDCIYEQSTNEDNAYLTFELEAEKTSLLLSTVHKPYSTDINDILLCALGYAVIDLFNIDKILIIMEGHGRENILENVHIDRTVGWFTSVFPVLFDFSFKEDMERQILEVKDTFHRIPFKGVGYGILKYLSPFYNNELSNTDIYPQIMFNYLGQTDEDIKDGLFTIASENQGNILSNKDRRNCDLDFLGIIRNKSLLMTLSYGRNNFSLRTMQKLMDHYHERLNQIIEFCSDKKEKVMSPSDFMYKKLSIEELDNIFN